MKKFFRILLCVGVILFVSNLQQAFCQQRDLVERAGIADADRIELASEISFESPAQPLRIIKDSAQIKDVLVILEKALVREPCDCLPEYTLSFYKNDVLLTKIAFGSTDAFLRYETDDYTLPKELLTFLEL